MKKKTVIAMSLALAIAVALSLGGAQAASYSHKTKTQTPQADWNISSKEASSLSANTDVTFNYTLPTTLNEVNTTVGPSSIKLVINSGGGSNAIYNLTVNGQSVASSATIGSGTVTKNLSDLDGAGVNLSADYLDVTFNMNETCTAFWLNSTVTGVNTTNVDRGVSQKATEDPHIGDSATDTERIYNVEDTISVTNNADAPFNITSIQISVNYPDPASNQPVSSFNLTDLNASETQEKTIAYQRAGAYIESAKDVSAQNQVNLSVYSYEDYSNIVDMHLDLKEHKALKGKTITKVEVNGEEVNYETGSIILNDVSLNQGQNTITLHYRPRRRMMPPMAAKPWYQQGTLGLANWVWLVIAGAVAIATGLAYREAGEGE